MISEWSDQLCVMFCMLNMTFFFGSLIIFHFFFRGKILCVIVEVINIERRWKKRDRSTEKKEVKSMMKYSRSFVHLGFFLFSLNLFLNVIIKFDLFYILLTLLVPHSYDSRVETFFFYFINNFVIFLHFQYYDWDNVMKQSLYWER